MARKSKRRGNREGTIFQRKNGQWVVSLTVEKQDGTTKRVSRNAKSQAHGRILLAELRDEFSEPVSIESAITVGELCERWYKSKKRDRSTNDTYNRIINVRIKPLIGNVPCREFKMVNVEDWLHKLEADEVPGRTLQMSFEVLSYSFTYGVKRELVKFNPCDNELKPKVESVPIMPFSDDEAKKILRHVKGDRLEALHVLAFAIGARQGELFGLQWRDIDWENGTIRIERQAQDAMGLVTIKTPKTAGSCRTVNVPQTAMDALRERRKFALKEKKAGPESFVFPGSRSQVMRRTNFSRRYWTPMLAELGIKHRGYHHVRHTAATTLLRLGNPVHVVSHILGHSSPATTSRVYSHYIPKDGVTASERMDIEMSRLIS